MRPSRIVLAASLLTLSGAAAAQTARDAKCILASNAFTRSAKDPKAEKVAEASLYFYLGRIDSSTTPAQLKALLEVQAKTMSDATVGKVMNDCVQDLESKVHMLESISETQKKPEGR